MRIRPETVRYCSPVNRKLEIWVNGMEYEIEGLNSGGKDENIVQKIEAAASARGLNTRRMTSGAGQDAQMMARICPTAMIFVPSIKGISHNPKEYTPDEDCVAGANVFLDVVSELAGAMTFC